MADSLEKAVDDTMEMPHTAPNILPTELCAECKDSCCQLLPGAFFPNDLGDITVESVVAFVLSGRACIDWWECDPREVFVSTEEAVSRGCFLRPRTVAASDRPVDASWGGVCTHLSDAGCMLTRDEMPTACKALEPGKDGCVDHSGGKNGAAMAWLPYCDVMENAIGICQRENVREE